MTHCRTLFTALVLVLATACSTHTTKEPYPVIVADSQVVAEMASIRQTAAANKQLAMYVLGANWCHDSTDFANLLADPTVAPLIQERYAVQFINVGNLAHIKPFVTPYGMPIIYTTPTVLVVDPASNRLLNRVTASYWGTASTRNSADAYDYFQQFSATAIPPVPAKPSAALQKALDSINAFEDAQAQRIYAAYAELSKLMVGMDAGHKPSAEFGSKWTNLARMRSAIIVDLQTLRNDANAQNAAGVQDITLVFPSYSLFTDQP